MTRTSVIVPTRDRPDPLRTCLASLAAQEGTGAFEVIVVDDALTPDPAVAAIVGSSPLPIRLLHGGGGGTARARNSGVAASDGDLVVFLDGDVEAPPGWLASHQRAHAERDDEVIVVGAPEPTQAGQTLVERLVRAWWRDEITARERALAAADIDVLGSNLSAPRTLLLRLGGFDAAFGALRREDYEFGARAHAAGVEVVHCADAAVAHDVSMTTAGRLRAAAAEGAGDRLMALSRPDLIPAIALRASYHDPLALRARVAGAAWRRPRGRRLLLAVLDRLERARLVRAWLTVFNAAQDAAWHTGAGVAPYGTVAPAATTALELDDDARIDLPRGPAGGIDALWRGRPVGLARPRGGRYGAEFVSDLARQVPPAVLLQTGGPVPDVVTAAPDRLAALTPAQRKAPLLLLTCDGSTPPSEWLVRAAHALQARNVAAVVHAPGRLPAGFFELHSRRTRRVPHTLLRVPPLHVLVRPATLGRVGIRLDDVLQDAGPWVAALDLCERALASDLQVGLLEPVCEPRSLGADARRAFWHARGVLEARGASGALPYLRRHALGSARQIAISCDGGRTNLAAAYLRGAAEGRAHRAHGR